MSDFSTAHAAPGSGTFSVGAVLKRSFSTFFANFVPFCVLALIFYLPTLISGFSTNFSAGGGVEVEGIPQYGAGDFAIILLSMVLTYALVGALVYGTVQHLNGRKAGIGEIIGHGFSRIVPVIAIAIIFSIALSIGFLLLIIPGIFLVVVWSVAIPASVVERPGIFGAFSRSWDLTKGYRWPVLGLLLILLAILLGFGLVTGAVAGFVVFSMDSLMLLVIVNYVISAISGTLMSVVIAVLYHDLRVAKEGVSTAQIAAVFD
ncbi:MAG: hypothetical protein ACFCUT_17915 [Kiloniellaceae bacterium]